MKNSKSADVSAEQPKCTWQTIVEALKKDIIYGRLQPKEHLLEDELMTRFGGSRYAVRRALEELHAVGLAVRTENRGTRIRSYSPKEVLELYEMREIMEREAALRIPMDKVVPLIAELTRIQKGYDKASRSGDWHSIHLLNEAFHRTLFAACLNQLLSEHIAALALQVQPVRIRFQLNEERRRLAGRDHWAVIEALKEGSSAKLAEVCARHISFGREEYARTLLLEPSPAAAQA